MGGSRDLEARLKGGRGLHDCTMPCGLGLRVYRVAAVFAQVMFCRCLETPLSSQPGNSYISSNLTTLPNSNLLPVLFVVLCVEYCCNHE